MIYLKYLRIHLRSAFQYRALLVFIAFARFLTSFGIFLGLVFLSERFGNIKGWDFWEIALCFGITGRSTEAFYMLSPIVGILFVFPCLLIWRIGIKHYASAGS